jgi:hypothetical protein
MKRFTKLLGVLALLVALASAPACQRMVEVQNGTRTVDSQGRVVSENIHTVRVAADRAGAYRVTTIVLDAATEARLAGLYAQAQAAIAAGDVSLAQTKLSEIILITPDYRDAKQQSDAIKGGKKVVADSTGGAPTPPKSGTPTASTPPAEASSALVSWTPDNLTGFVAAKPTVDPLSVSREYTPGSGNPAKSLVVAADQYRTSTDAKSALEVNVKQRYPKNASSLTVHGHTVYFGTDGHRFAVMGFTSGAVVVALEAEPDSGSPSAMKATLEKVVGQLP